MRSLDRIAAHVTEISGVVVGIAASASEQVIGLAEMNAAIKQMGQATQQNAAMVGQSTAASHRLAREAAELARLTRRFELGMQPSEPARAEASQPARAVPLRSPPRPARQAARQAWTGRPGFANAAPKLAVVGDEAGRQGF